VTTTINDVHRRVSNSHRTLTSVSPTTVQSASV